MTATLITDFSGHVTHDILMPIVTDDGVAGFQVAGQVCLVLDGELVDARQGSVRSWTAVSFDERHEEAARQYNQSPARKGAWTQSRIKVTPKPPPVTGDAAGWKARALEAEAKLSESRRQVELLLGEVACLRDALARRLHSAS